MFSRKKNKICLWTKKTQCDSRTLIKETRDTKQNLKKKRKEKHKVSCKLILDCTKKNCCSVFVWGIQLKSFKDS